MDIREHAILDLFEPFVNIKFFLLPNLTSFDGIIGNDTLKELGISIHTNKNCITTHDKVIPIKQHISNSVNTINIRTSHMNTKQTEKLKELIKRCPNVFSEPNKKLTYTTKVKGEIRLTSNEPMYSRPYPYPMCLKEEVEKEIHKLLKDGIIRPSRSPYNSPVWIVPKKADASGEKKHRLVIDYRKLNSICIADKYPIPEINEVLANLGQNQFFSIIDLKSGFHQIPLREADIEKTAFSVNNGKYEFTRLPFGLKNAPSIFQRTLDDILREHIGKICYVYIDDIIIFGKDENEHFANLETIFNTLEKSNMKIQLDKCEFLHHEVEFLGFLVSKDGIKTNPKKVETIASFPSPKTLRDLRSFLGMSGYYRRFIKDYAKLAKPLTSLLRGEDGQVSKNASKNKIINLTEEAVTAFEKIKSTLISKEVILSHPNFEKEFELTTDASEYAIGAVLSQDDKPITFLSRTLSKTEESYAANEKEMLAIIWSLGSLRNYLYGSRRVKIFTDHQPLTFALSNKNTNAKMKRWKSILEEYNYELKYKPGKSNVVADALSRYPQVNALTHTQHSDESSGHHLIPTIETPINVFRNQLILKIGEENSYQLTHPFPTYNRHTIIQPHYSDTDILNIFKSYLNPNIVNGLLTEESTMGRIQELYPIHFAGYKIRFTQKFVKDITNETMQDEIVWYNHRRAHRNPRENKLQIIEKFYFPGINKKLRVLTKQCEICKENKYERHPNKPIINSTPIPSYPGHIVHMDILTTEGRYALTALDKFTKFGQARFIESRAVEDIRRPLRDILFSFSIPENVVIDNERSLISASLISMMSDELKIKVFTTPPYKSEINGQVERFHSTLAEIMRCLKAEEVGRNFEELLERSINEYNHTFHSATGKKPVELFYGRTPHITPEEFEKTRMTNVERLKQKQAKDIKNHNKRRQPIKTYTPGQTIFVKINKRLGSKTTPRFRKEIVKENKNSVVITESGKTVHKSHIRN